MTRQNLELPETIRDTGQLEDMLSEPDTGLVDMMRRVTGDVMILGAGGKMGPTLARMAKRARDASGTEREVIAVSRFSDAAARQGLDRHGVRTIACDLLDREQVGALPDAPLVVFMAGMKFGTTGAEAMTWAMNAYLPALVCERFPHSRIAVFSTGNVYALAPAESTGAVETDIPDPKGEYAMSTLGRERIFEYFSRRDGTAVVIIRLNYAVEMRYGVLADIARRVWDGEEIDVGMGYANVIWQADASSAALRSLEHAATPPFLVNVTGPERISVRETAEELGMLMGRAPVFRGTESADALLSNAAKAHSLFGAPRVGIPQILRWTADWVMRGRETLNKPTHYESRDGRF